MSEITKEDAYLRFNKELMRRVRVVAAVIKAVNDTEIVVGDLIDTIEYDYPDFHLSMDCFWCEIVSGDLVLKEHEAAKWLTKEKLGTVEWLPADVTVMGAIKEGM